MAETIFVDTSGNTPATWGDSVGLIKDSSGNGNDIRSHTVTARPILGRVPRGGRRNLLNNTEDLDTWIRYPGSAATVERQEEGWFLWTRLRDDINTLLLTRNMDVEEGSVYSLSADIEVISGNLQIDLSLRNRLSSGVSGPIYTLTTGQSLRLEAEGLIASGVERGFQFRAENIDASVPTILRIRNPQLERGEVVTPFQHVTSPYDITESGVPEVHYLDFDGTDDLISTELPAISNGTLVLAGTGGIWIDEDYNFDGGTFSIGRTSYTNGPEGILTAIGEPIVGGFLVISRQLSQRELELVIQEMKERGAPGMLELGPELVVNGDFSDGSTGWSGSAGANSVSIDTTHNTARLT